MNKSFEAWYKYEGYDKDLGNYAKKYERLLTEDQKRYGGAVVWLAKVLRDREVSFKWSF